MGTRDLNCLVLCVIASLCVDFLFVVIALDLKSE